MKLKSFIIGMISFVLTTGLLSAVGYLFKIPLLMFHYEYTDYENDFYIITGSLFPILIGFAVSFFAEKIYQHKFG